MEVQVSENEVHDMMSVDDDDYGDDVQMSQQEQQQPLVRIKASPKPKPIKLAKKQSTTSRFKSHGFAKEDFDYQ